MSFYKKYFALSLSVIFLACNTDYKNPCSREADRTISYDSIFESSDFRALDESRVAASFWERRIATDAGVANPSIDLKTIVVDAENTQFTDSARVQVDADETLKKFRASTPIWFSKEHWFVLVVNGEDDKRLTLYQIDKTGIVSTLDIPEASCTACDVFFVGRVMENRLYVLFATHPPMKGLGVLNGTLENMRVFAFDETGKPVNSHIVENFSATLNDTAILHQAFRRATPGLLVVQTSQKALLFDAELKLQQTLEVSSQAAIDVFSDRFSTVGPQRDVQGIFVQEIGSASRQRLSGLPAYNLSFQHNDNLFGIVADSNFFIATLDGKKLGGDFPLNETGGNRTGLEFPSTSLELSFLLKPPRPLEFSLVTLGDSFNFATLKCRKE